MRGGNGMDVINYKSSNAGVKIDLANLTASGGHAAGDDFNGMEGALGSEFADVLAGDSNPNYLGGWAGDDALRGRGGADRLFGETGDDVLEGGSGNDELRGGSGRDVMEGGNDHDTFSFISAFESQVGAGIRDFIKDFVSGVDKIDLSGIDASSIHTGEQAFKFIAGHTFNGIAGALRYKTEGGNTILEGDLDGNKIADFQIELKGIIDLALTDFIL